MSEVRIAGVGLHPFGRFEGVTATDMGVVAVRGALAEAGLGVHDVEAAFCGTAYGGVASGHRVLGALAGTGIPIYDVEAGCASGGAALQLAAASIASGQHDHVLVFGIEKMPKGVIRSSFFAPWQEAAGLSPAPAYFALRAARLLAETDLTADDLAEVVVKNRAHGVHNPDAMFQKAVTAEEVLSSRMVCPPLTLFMLCSPNEGAAAVVLGRDGDGVGVAGISLRSHLPGNVLGEDTPMSGIEDTDITPPTSLAAEDAYKAAGLGPDDVDVVECQDTDTAPRADHLGRAGSLCAGRTKGDPVRRERKGRGEAADQPIGRPSLEGRTARRVRARSGRRAGATAEGFCRCTPGRGGPGRPRPRDRPWRERLCDHPGSLTKGVGR